MYKEQNKQQLTKISSFMKFEIIPCMRALGLRDRRRWNTCAEHRIQVTRCMVEYFYQYQCMLLLLHIKINISVDAIIIILLFQQCRIVPYIINYEKNC